MSPQDQAAKDKALQSMAAMSSAQIISAAAFHSKMTLTRGPGYPAVSGVSGAACSQRLDHPVLLPPPPSEETRRWPHQSRHVSLLREGGTKDPGPCRCWNCPLGPWQGHRPKPRHQMAGLGALQSWPGFPVALVVKNPPARAGDMRYLDPIPGWGRSPGGGHGSPLQYSCLENPMDRGAWWATVHSKQWDVTEAA